jgi:putative DNA primase/helicase
MTDLAAKVGVPTAWRGVACKIFDEEIGKQMGDVYYSKAQELSSKLCYYEEMSFEPSPRERAILDAKKQELEKATEWIRKNVLENPLIKDRMYETVSQLGKYTGFPEFDKELRDYLDEMNKTKIHEA